MKRSKLNRAKLMLEALEDRWCPALTIDSTGGILSVSGDPVGILTLTQTAQGVWTVNDAGTDLATLVSANGGVKVTTSTDDDSIIIDNAGAFTIAGNVSVDSGNGNDTVRISNAGAAMTIAGLLSINTGNGDDTVLLSPGGALTVQGSRSSTWVRARPTC